MAWRGASPEHAGDPRHRRGQDRCRVYGHLPDRAYDSRADRPSIALALLASGWGAGRRTTPHARSDPSGACLSDESASGTTRTRFNTGGGVNRNASPRPSLGHDSPGRLSNPLGVALPAGPSPPLSIAFASVFVAVTGAEGRGRLRPAPGGVVGGQPVAAPRRCSHLFASQPPGQPESTGDNRLGDAESALSVPAF
jgi:hypothetical protein